MISYKKTYHLITIGAFLIMQCTLQPCKTCDAAKSQVTTVMTTISSHTSQHNTSGRMAAHTSPHTDVSQPSFGVISELIETGKKNAPLIIGTALAAGVVSYLGYAVYVDYRVNKAHRFWHWVSHALKDGSLDNYELLEYINNRYHELEKIHPLTAIFAALHDVELEIQDCLQLRSVMQNLTFFKVQGILSDNMVTINKKIEYLYILKMALMAMSTETRKRCRKNIELNT